ncbi:MAG: hypothetical protein ACE5E6_11100 [Phycisphaerae bacterium]
MQFWRSVWLLVFCAGGVVLVAGRASGDPVPTTLADFFRPGTQPDESGGLDFAPIQTSYGCSFCHELGDPEVPVFTRWAGSMMGQSARDPLFHACLAIANQDATDSGDICLRCHTPGGWLAGRSVPTDGSALIPDDFDGVTCHFCHRLVDPVFAPGMSPPEDQAILDALEAAGLLPELPGGASYVVDPRDVRRGPFDDVPLNAHGVPILWSPFHSASELCATCHDVSNPAFSRKPDGTYVLNELGAPHETLNKYDMFPVERTYSEWLHSEYATIGVDSGGVFGGNHPTGIMHTCQDCHMPDTEARGCAFDDPFFVRPNVPAHDFNGGNTWMQDVLVNLFPLDVNPTYMAQSQARALYMLENAATVEVTHDACSLSVRVVNETGHKLPSGYPEGRRMWINVVFRDDTFLPVAERGAYDAVTAALTTADTTVFEAELGVDEAVSGATGIPVGPSFHFAVNNVYYKDNRIPPRGFTNEAFDAIGAAPVGAVYADGQYWHDTVFHVPPGATSAVVRLYYQTTSKEYVTFLRDENHTNDAGDVLYDEWARTGKSPPVLMREVIVSGLTSGGFGDADCDGDVDLVDYAVLAGCVSGPGATLSLGCGAVDYDLDGDVDVEDFGGFQVVFGAEP